MQSAADIPMVLGQVDGVSGHMVAVDAGALVHWNMAAHGPTARQFAGSGVGGPVVFEGVHAVGWPGRGSLLVRGARSTSGTGWAFVEVVLGSAPPSPSVGPAVGQLELRDKWAFIGDLAALGHWAPGRSVDGQHTLTFGGREADQLAALGQVPALGGGRYGWEGLPENQALQWKAWMDQQIAASVFSVDVDHDPHDHFHLGRAQAMGSPVGAGLVQVDGRTCLVLDTGQAGVVAAVHALLDARGQGCGVRVVFEAPTVGAPSPMPPDPKTAAKEALKSAAVDHVQGAATKAAWRKVKSVLPRWAWPLLPDGKRDFATRAKDLGRDKLIGMAVGCLFSGCLMLVMGLGFLSLVLYIVWEVVRNL